MNMKFKNFEFPANPETVSVDYSDNIREFPLFDSDSAVCRVSRNAAQIRCGGAFWGEDRLVLAQELKGLFRDCSSGWLFLPDGECFDAFLVSLSVTETAKKGCVSYSMVFRENCSHKKSTAQLDCTYAQENENMFDIAYRCGARVETLMELNEYKTPFSVQAGDRVMLK